MDAGFAFSIHGGNPTLAPLNGGRHIRLQRLKLRTAFWVRFHDWGEPFTSLGWTQDAPERFWRALTGERLDAAQLRSVRKFQRGLGDESVTDAMRIAAECPGMRTDEPRFRYFCGVCWNRIRERAAAGSSLPPLAPELCSHGRGASRRPQRGREKAIPA